jgi:hypothetical protein
MPALPTLHFKETRGAAPATHNFFAISTTSKKGLSMKKHLLVLAIASSCFAMTAANAADAMTKDQYKVAKEKISADYKVAKAKCDTLKDNAKDVCEKEAKGTENVAKAVVAQHRQLAPQRDHGAGELDQRVVAAVPALQSNQLTGLSWQ